MVYWDADLKDLVLREEDIFVKGQGSEGSSNAVAEGGRIEAAVRASREGMGCRGYSLNQGWLNTYNTTCIYTVFMIRYGTSIKGI